MAQRTDQEITDDFALSDSSTLIDEKTKGPSNYNQYLLLEVLLDIREKLHEVKVAIESNYRWGQ